MTVPSSSSLEAQARPGATAWRADISPASLEQPRGEPRVTTHHRTTGAFRETGIQCGFQSLTTTAGGGAAAVFSRGVHAVILARFFRHVSGATSIEYAMIGALLSIAIMGAVTSLGDRVGLLYGSVELAVSEAAP